MTNDIADGINIFITMGTGRIIRLLGVFCDLSVPLPWKDFIFVLQHFGAEVDNKTGSAARAITIQKETFNAHEPHDREKMVHKSDRQRAIQKLKLLGLLKDNEGGD